MALLSGLTSIIRGTQSTITLDKTALFALTSIQADAYFSLPENVSKAKFTYKSPTGMQFAEAIFDIQATEPVSKIKFSAHARTSFTLSDIVLYDFDGGYLKVAASDIPAGLDLSFVRSGMTLVLDMEGDGIHNEAGPQAVTLVGSAAASTEQSKYGVKSLKLTNPGDYASCTTEIGDFKDRDFTVQLWAYFTQNNIGYQGIFSKSGPSDAHGYALVLETDNVLSFYASHSGGSWAIGIRTSYVPPVNQWVHLAVVRYGTTVSVYANGVLQGNAGFSGSIETTSEPFIVGNYLHFPYGQISMKGYIDDFGVTEGVAVYTTNFTPPGPLENIGQSYPVTMSNFYNNHQEYLSTSGADGDIFVWKDFVAAGFGLSDLNYIIANYGSNFAQANFKNVNLNGYSLTNITFDGADFAGSNLKNVDLSGSSVVGANFTSALMEGATLLVSGDLTAATLTNASYSGTTTFPNGFDPVAAGMISALAAFYNAHQLWLETSGASGTRFNWSDFSNAGFTVADFNYILASIGSNFTSAIISSANLYNLSAVGANFTGANLTFTNFMNADLRNATFSGAYFYASQLGTAQFTGAYYDNNMNSFPGYPWDLGMLNVQAISAVQDHALWIQSGGASGTQLTSSIVGGFGGRALVVAAKATAHTDLSGAELNGIVFGPGDITGLKFQNCSLSSANFGGTDMSGVDFSGSNMSSSNISYSTATGTKFNGVNLSSTGNYYLSANGASFVGAYLNNFYLYGGNTFVGADFSYVTWNNSACYGNEDFTDAKFDHSNISGFYVYSGTFVNTSFKYGAYNSFYFFGGTLTACHFEGANAVGLYLVPVDVTGSFYDLNTILPGWWGPFDPDARGMIYLGAPYLAVGTYAGGDVSGYSSRKYGNGLSARMSGMTGITVAPNGNVIVASTNSEVDQIAPNGDVSRFVASYKPNPHGLAFDSSGNMAVAEAGYYRISTVDSYGNDIGVLAGSSSSPGYSDGVGDAARFTTNMDGIAYNANGDLYVCDNERLRKVAADGTVTTIAGSTYFQDGDKDHARFSYLNTTCSDSQGNLFLFDHGANLLKKMDALGNVVTFAGGGGVTNNNSGWHDGTGVNALFYDVAKIAIDGADNIYVLEKQGGRVRKVTPAAEVTTLAGSGSYSFYEGQGMAAGLGYPQDIAVAADGTVYGATVNGMGVFKIDTNGNVTRYAGTGGWGGADGDSLTEATFVYPGGIALDSLGNVYVADTYGQTIRKVSTSGVVTTLAGIFNGAGLADGTGAGALFYYPGSVVCDSSDNLYVTDYGTNQLRKITPEAVVTTIGSYNFASYAAKPSLALDGSMYYGGGNYLYKIDLATGIQTTEVGYVGFKLGDGSQASLGYLSDVAIHPVTQEAYVAGGGFIAKITDAGVVSLYAGNPNIRQVQDGTLATAYLSSPVGLTFDSSGNLYFTEYANHKIRKIDTDGNVTTVVGDGQSDIRPGQGTLASIQYPTKMTIDANGTLYVIVSNNVEVVAIDSGLNLIEFAGGSNSWVDAQGKAAKFYQPRFITKDSSGNTYVTELYHIRKIDSAGNVTLLAGGETSGSVNGVGRAARFLNLQGITVDSSGNLYVCDQNFIRKVSPTGDVESIAGDYSAGFVDGTGSEARFNNPMGITMGPDGFLYVADFNNHSIRKVSTLGVVTTVTGSPYTPGYQDGSVSTAQLSGPIDIVSDAFGTLYIADKYNYRVRKIFANTVSTVAGNGNNAAVNGQGTGASFGPLNCITLDDAGNIYVADQAVLSVRKIDVAGDVTTYAGNGGWGYSNGPALTTPAFEMPYGMHFDVSQGNLYVVDFNDNLIRYVFVKGSTPGSTTYSVSYVGNGNTAGTVPVDTALYTNGSSIIVPGNTGNLVKNDDTFLGWNTQPDGSGTDYVQGSTLTITGDVVLYAKWLPAM